MGDAPTRDTYRTRSTPAAFAASTTLACSSKRRPRGPGDQDEGRRTAEGLAHGLGVIVGRRTTPLGAWQVGQALRTPSEQELGYTLSGQAGRKSETSRTGRIVP